MTSETSVKTVEKMHQAIIDFYGSPYLPFRSGSEDQYDNYACTIRYRLSDGKELERTYYLPMEITDESSSETVWKLAIPEENLEKMAAVMALDEYQSYVLYYYQQPSQIATVLSDRRESEGEYMGEQALSKSSSRSWEHVPEGAQKRPVPLQCQGQQRRTGEGETSYYINLESVAGQAVARRPEEAAGGPGQRPFPGGAAGQPDHRKTAPAAACTYLRAAPRPES